MTTKPKMRKAKAPARGHRKGGEVFLALFQAS
jgi:hypothetical protein